MVLQNRLTYVIHTLFSDYLLILDYSDRNQISICTVCASLE